MKPLELIAKARVEHWVIASAFILLLDYLTGPFIQFPILFVVPVAVAVLLPLVTIVILPETGASGPLGAGMGGPARRCNYPERIRRDHSSDRPAAAPNQGARRDAANLQFLQTDKGPGRAVAEDGIFHF